jgi:hypothetical protein
MTASATPQPSSIYVYGIIPAADARARPPHRRDPGALGAESWQEQLELGELVAEQVTARRRSRA